MGQCLGKPANVKTYDSYTLEEKNKNKTNNYNNNRKQQPRHHNHNHNSNDTSINTNSSTTPSEKTVKKSKVNTTEVSIEEKRRNAAIAAEKRRIQNESKGVVASNRLSKKIKEQSSIGPGRAGSKRIETGLTAADLN